MSFGQERSLAERAELVPKRIELERTLALVTEADNQAAISKPEAALQSTPMPYPATATASQEILTTPITAKTLLLLTYGLQFDRIATYVVSEPAQSSTSQSWHTAKFPFEAPSNVDAFLDVTEVQMDLLLANQHIIMAN